LLSNNSVDGSLNGNSLLGGCENGHAAAIRRCRSASRLSIRLVSALLMLVMLVDHPLPSPHDAIS
jgi:hypothetical protein